MLEILVQFKWQDIDKDDEMNSLDKVVEQMKSISSQTVAQKPVVTNDLPSVALASWMPASKGVVSAMIRVLSRSTPSPSAISAATQNMFDQQLVVVPGTIKIVDHNLGVMTAAVKLAKNTIKYVVVGEPKGFRMVARNVFMDERDSTTWNMVENNGQQVLVRHNQVETDKDLEQLLASVSSASHFVTKEHKMLEAAASAIPTAVGTFLSFVEGQDHLCGFIVDHQHNGNLIGVLTAAAKVHYIGSNNVVQVFDARQLQTQIKVPKVSENLASISTQRPGIDTMIDFYRKIYGENADFFKKFEQELKTYKFAG